MFNFKLNVDVLLLIVERFLSPFCSLNVLSLRRNLAADMKHPMDTSTVSSRFSFSRTMHAPTPKLYRPLVVSAAIGCHYKSFQGTLNVNRGQT